MAIRPDDHEVLDVLSVELDPPVHHIVERRLAWRDLETDGARCLRGFELGNALARKVQAAAVILPGRALLLGLLALLAQPFGGAVAVVGPASGDKRRGGGAMTIVPL